MYVFVALLPVGTPVCFSKLEVCNQDLLYVIHRLIDKPHFK